MVQQHPHEQNPFAISVDAVATNAKLREPQREGYLALHDFWRRSKKPTIVQVPVGCGKTGLMAILPFGNCASRALYIAPNVTIRAGLAAAVDTQSKNCFWEKVGVGRLSRNGPSAVLDGPNAQMSDCDNSHFIVTNIQQIVAAHGRWLNRFPPDYFDLILIDEGHHNAAPSWRKVLDRFEDAKIVSLTATPFRSDGQNVVGEMVYRYSFTRAMAKGYTKSLRAVRVAPRQIHFTYRDDTQLHTLEEVLALREETWFRRGVALAPKCNWDIVRASVQKCVELRKGSSFPHQIIAATCSIDHAQQVRSLYERMGIRARDIHSQMKPIERRQVISDLRAAPHRLYRASRNARRRF